MAGYIKSIRAPIPNFKNKETEINLPNGEHLILVGKNGCGKTSFLNSIYNKLNKYLTENIPQQILSNTSIIQSWEHSLQQLESQTPKNHQQIHNLKTNIQDYTSKNQALKAPPDFTFTDEDTLLKWSTENNLFIEFFTANRTANIKSPQGVIGGDLSKKQLKEVGAHLEQYLVNLDNQALHQEHRVKNTVKATEIKKWIQSFEENLRFLTEDDTTKLNFDFDNYKAQIIQSDKQPYSFQNLSSGFSAIFNILAPLIMTGEYYKILPTELKGIVFIDEIDAHLHVSLQKKILPFLVRSFSSIQFIVTTHSPFIVTSLKNAVVYDLSSLEQLTDLTTYSYESIIEGLFGVSTSSEILEGEIKKIIRLIDNKQTDTGEFQETVENLRKDQDKMDPESLYFWSKADLILKKNKNNV